MTELTKQLRSAKLGASASDDLNQLLENSARKLEEYEALLVKSQIYVSRKLNKEIDKALR